MKSKISKIALIIAAGAFTLTGLFAANNSEMSQAPKFKDIKVANNSDYEVELTFFEANGGDTTLSVDAHNDETESLQWFGEGIALTKMSVVVHQDDIKSAPMTSDIAWNGSEARLSAAPADAKVKIKAGLGSDPKDLVITITNAMAQTNPLDTTL